ncbi:MAG TPA: Fe-S protein assembly co-chaperone HscB [Fimbriiglobus sp.]|jgi:molecular chaperone HscB
MDAFERLGLPRRFSVDPVSVEREYLARSRESHPDYHATADAAGRQSSLEDTAALNEAYVTLTDPFRRADYLARLLGGTADKTQDQSFLMEMMETRERIEEIRAAGGSLVEIEGDLRSRLDTIAAGLVAKFEKSDLAGVRKDLNAAKTIQSLLRDLSPD